MWEELTYSDRSVLLLRIHVSPRNTNKLVLECVFSLSVTANISLTSKSFFKISSQIDFLLSSSVCSLPELMWSWLFGSILLWCILLEHLMNTLYHLAWLSAFLTSLLTYGPVLVYSVLGALSHWLHLLCRQPCLVPVVFNTALAETSRPLAEPLLWALASSIQLSVWQ